MAKFGSFKDGQIILNGNDLSSNCRSFILNTETEELPNHAMGDYTAFNTPGLLSWSVEAEFFLDFAAANVHVTLENLRSQLASLDVPPTFPLTLKGKKSLATSTTNPVWSGSGFISAYKPIGEEHGENAMVEVTISAAGNLSVLTS